MAYKKDCSRIEINTRLLFEKCGLFYTRRPIPHGVSIFLYLLQLTIILRMKKLQSNRLPKILYRARWRAGGLFIWNLLQFEGVFNKVLA